MSSPAMFAIGAKSWPGLSKLSEEAGEVVQVVGKLMGTGGEIAHWDGTNLRGRLVDEMGDLLAAIRYVAKHHGFEQAVEIRARGKLATFERWHEEQQG